MSQSPSSAAEPTLQPDLARCGVFAGRAWLAWVVGVLLMLPGFLPYVHHLTHVPEGSLATAYLAGDSPYYLGNARAQFEDGFSPLYALRFTPDPSTPRVYFQPETLFFGMIVKLSGERLLLSYLIFWFVGATLMARAAIALYERVVGLGTKAHWAGLVLFFWGGGLYLISGAIRGAVTGTGLAEVWHFDPFEGWWFINLGRNFVIPHETYIHAFFFTTIILVMDRKWLWALGMACVTSWAHPFTGIQMLLILGAWFFVERVIVKRPEPSWKWAGGLAVLIAIHLGYHKVLLPWISHDHYVIMQQWSVAWVFRLSSQALGFALVLALVGATVAWVRPWREVIGDPAQRLLIVWFLVTLGLVNHELFIKPVQPLHFTRGYDWIPLFLLGAPALIAGITWLTRPSRQVWGTVAAGVLGVFFMLDNIGWLADPWLYQAVGKPESTLVGTIYKPKNVEALLQRLKEPDAQGSLFINMDQGSPLGYLVASETYLRSWLSHPHCTPYFEARNAMSVEFYNSGKCPPEWDERRLLIAYGPRDRDFIVQSLEQNRMVPPYLVGMGAKVFYVNDQYVVFVVEPKVAVTGGGVLGPAGAP
jgi:hypothetical protein